MPPANTPADNSSLSPLRSEPLPASISDTFRAHPPSEFYITPPTQAEASRPRIGALYSIAQHRSRHSASHDHAGGDAGRPRRPSASRLRRSSRDTESRQPRDQAYGARIPLARPGQRQALYDWAPTYANDDDFESRALPPLLDRGAMDEEDARLLPFSLRAYTSLRDATSRYGDTYTPPGDSTFRMAFMQSLRNSAPRRNQRSRPSWQEWSSERDRGRENRDELGRPRPEWSDPRARAREASLSDASEDVEKVINYLSCVRGCRSKEESLELATHAGFNQAEEWLLETGDEQPCDDFVLDTTFLSAAETSWLKIGGVFWGSQTTPTVHGITHRSTHSSSSSLSSLPSISSLPSNTTAPIPSVDGGSRRTGNGGSSTSSTSSTSSVSSAGTGTGTVASNQWTVRVNISSVDYSQMRLTGTMEAFTDHPNSVSSITYFEGEIIDFNKHSFETSNFKSNIKDDANYWRKLEPFASMTNDEIVKRLVSRKFMKHLTETWVFMRWKEKCFITPETDPESGGLTIGGFYFLSMRREDGHIQGYYYDPQSQPFQELSLKPQNKRLFPTYQFR